MTEDLSEIEREERAREVYKCAEDRFIFWFFALMLLSSVAVGAIARLFDFPDWVARVLLLVLLAVAYFPWDARVKASIRRTGLPTQSRSETEIAQRTPGALPGKWKEVNPTLDVGVHVAVTLCFVIPMLLLVNQIFPTGKHTFDLNLFLFATGACCLAFVPLNFLKHKSSTVRIDERGVFAYAFYFLPRLVRWEEIDQVYVRRVYHPLTGKEDLNLLLKNAQGKTVLALGGIAFKGIARKKSNQIVGEIGRRFYGES